jgi:hypothetical protein
VSSHATSGLDAIWLSWFTIVFNLIEGVVSIRFGVSEDSISLSGFGADSFIEVALAALVLWRFRGETGQGGALSVARERKATFGIGALFIFLSALTLVASGYQLYSKKPSRDDDAWNCHFCIKHSFHVCALAWKSKSGEVTSELNGRKRCALLFSLHQTLQHSVRWKFTISHFPTVLVGRQRCRTHLELSHCKRGLGNG